MITYKGDIMKDNKQTVINLMRNGMPYECVIEILLDMVGDKDLKNECNYYLQLSQHADKKKDLTAKLNTLGDKVDAIGSHMNEANQEHLEKIAEIYYAALLRIQQKIKQ